MTRAPLSIIARIFFRIGNVTFGSGNLTSALLRDELVGRRGWMSAEQFASSFSLARVTPGTNLLAFCTAAGWFMRGIPGALAALLPLAAPASVVTVLLTFAYERWHESQIGAGAVSGAMAAVVGVILAGGWLLIRPHVTNREWPRTAALVLCAFLLSLWAGFSPLPIICFAAIVGFLWQ